MFTSERLRDDWRVRSVGVRNIFIAERLAYMQNDDSGTVSNRLKEDQSEKRARGNVQILPLLDHTPSRS